MHLDHSAFVSDAIELKSADDGGNEIANDIVTKALETLTATVDDRFKAVETKSAARMDKIEARLNRPTTDFVSTAGDTEAEKQAVASFYRDGSNVELKALSTTAGTTGIMAPPQLSTTILEKITLVSPVRQLSSIVNMTGGMISIPRLVNEIDVPGVTELTPDPRPDAEPSFEQIDLKSFEMSVFIPLSRQSLEDANVDLSGFLTNHLVRKFGEKESQWFVTGNGTTQPEGVMTSPEVGVFNATTTTITLDALIDLYHSLKAPYATAGAWLMNSKTTALIRKMKDGDGRPLWEPSLQIGQPATLFGRPVYSAPDMPDAAPNATPIIFGDFATGYLIADRIAFEPLRVDIANSPVIRIGGRRRVGGRVVMGEALTKLKLKA